MKNAIATAFALAFLSSAAWADSIVLSGPVALSGNGFGSHTTALTIRAQDLTATASSI
jgi:hypothetical protein